MVTSKAGAYYSLVSRLRRAEMPFASLLPDSDTVDCDIVLTTAEEAPYFGTRAVAVEELSENPWVFKGQVVSRLDGGREVMLIGIDPGKRIGLAVYYGRTKLAFSTFDSMSALCARVGAFANEVQASRTLIRIGNGNRLLARRLIEALEGGVPWVTMELVDESGTSARGARMKGVQVDQSAAARIAFRKGLVVREGGPRIRVSDSRAREV